MKFIVIVICVFITLLNSMICTCNAEYNFTYDAETINRVVYESYGQSEQQIIDIMLERTNAQRQEIAKEYQKLYQESLYHEMKKFFAYDMKEVITALMVPKDHFYVYQLHYAIEGLGTDEAALSEILGSMNRDEILKASEMYQNDYGVPLKDDIISDTSGEFKDLLVALCDVPRDGDEKVDKDAAKLDAQALNDTRKELINHGHSGVESTFRSIFTSRSRPHLKLIFEEYKKISNSTIIQTIKEQFDHDVQYTYLIIEKSAVLSRNKFYANLLRDSMMGLGTNDRQLIRIIVGRSEIDLKQIKETYNLLFETELADSIIADTSGKYKKVLLRIINK